MRSSRPFETKPQRWPSWRFSSSWRRPCGVVLAAPLTPGERRSSSTFRAHEVDGGLLPGVRDGVRLAVDLDVLAALQAAVAQLLEEGQQPLLAGEAGAGVLGSQALAGRLEGGPGGPEAVPAPAGGLVRLLARDQVIVTPGEAVDALRAFDEALEEVGREEGALGVDGRKTRPPPLPGPHAAPRREVDVGAQHVDGELGLDAVAGSLALHGFADAFVGLQDGGPRCRGRSSKAGRKVGEVFEQAPQRSAGPDPRGRWRSVRRSAGFRVAVRRPRPVLPRIREGDEPAILGQQGSLACGVLVVRCGTGGARGWPSCASSRPACE